MSDSPQPAVPASAPEHGAPVVNEPPAEEVLAGAALPADRNDLPVDNPAESLPPPLPPEPEPEAVARAEVTVPAIPDAWMSPTPFDPGFLGEPDESPPPTIEDDLEEALADFRLWFADAARGPAGLPPPAEPVI